MFYFSVILAQMHPSGIYSAILSFKNGKISFPNYNYIRIHVPLSCSCFARASSARYILSGMNIAGTLTLNNIQPLYEVKSYEQVKQIHRAMKILT